MALAVPMNLARRLIGDPVMAASVLMGADLDVFQAARFRTAWFTPLTLDHSGVSTGKTEIVFLKNFLRCFLLPNPPGWVPRIATVYYQSKGTAEEVFLPKIEKYCEKSKIFEMQLKVHRGKFWRTLDGCFLIEGRAGWRIELPAGDFTRDSKNQASKRFNDLTVDETGEIDRMGKGINTQLLQRNTLECFNPNHPVWSNHTTLLGHAESPEHPYHKRYITFKRFIRKGSQKHAVLTSSCYDYSGAHRKKYGQEAIAKAEDQKSELTPSEFAWIWLGLWKRGTKGWYTVTVRDAVRRSDLLPQSSRQNEDSFYFGGFDFAPGLTTEADFNAGSVLAADRVTPRLLESLEGNRVGICRIGDAEWFLRWVFSCYLHGRTTDQVAGVIHRLHRLFAFAALGLDGGGGGAHIYMKLRESRQFIDNQWTDVRGICMQQDSFEWPEADPIAHFYHRGDPLFRKLLGDRFVKDNSGPSDYAHTNMRVAMMRGEVACPAPLEQRGPDAFRRLSPEVVEQLGTIGKAMSQFGNIGVKVDKNNVPVLSELRFRKFDDKGRKTDGAMAKIYSFLTARAFLESLPHRPDSDTEVKIFS